MNGQFWSLFKEEEDLNEKNTSVQLAGGESMEAELFDRQTVWLNGESSNLTSYTLCVGAYKPLQ